MISKKEHVDRTDHGVKAVVPEVLQFMRSITKAKKGPPLWNVMRSCHDIQLDAEEKTRVHLIVNISAQPGLVSMSLNLFISPDLACLVTDIKFWKTKTK